MEVTKLNIKENEAIEVTLPNGDMVMIEAYKSKYLIDINDKGSMVDDNLFRRNY